MRLAVQLAFLLLGAGAARAASADGPRLGLERPGATIRWELPHKKRGMPYEAATRTCQVFSAYAVLTTDEGEMGLFDLELRARPKGMAPKEVCDAGFRGRCIRRQYPSALEEDYPQGIFGRFLFSLAPDAYGVVQAFTVLDLETGAPVYADACEYDREARFDVGADGPALTYWTLLEDFDCVPRRAESGCWTRIREKHGIPAAVPQPDCEQVISAEPTAVAAPERSVQITLHVRVQIFARRSATYLRDPPGCAAAP